jgi:hypothetical protein
LAHFSGFGIMYPEKSGNPAPRAKFVDTKYFFSGNRTLTILASLANNNRPLNLGKPSGRVARFIFAKLEKMYQMNTKCTK